jgi:hypothetical protein
MTDESIALVVQIRALDDDAVLRSAILIEKIDEATGTDSGDDDTLALFGISEPVRIEFQWLHLGPTNVAEGAEFYLDDIRLVEAL